MDTRQEEVIALEVTAQRHGPGGRPFRRVGRDFPLGKPVRVELAELTPDKAAFLRASDPRELAIREIYQGQEPERAAPRGDGSIMTGAPSPEAGSAGHSAETSAGGEDDDEPGDGEATEGADSVITSAEPARGRTNGGKKRRG